jgi:hypothetical protein
MASDWAEPAFSLCNSTSNSAALSREAGASSRVCGFLRHPAFGRTTEAGGGEWAAGRNAAATNERGGRFAGWQANCLSLWGA